MPFLILPSDGAKGKTDFTVHRYFFFNFKILVTFVSLPSKPGLKNPGCCPV